CARHWDYFDYW
nr:immunoglobulin heavy chain junction region [Mus musculus]MBK4185403.1 immunoglobulin heavy chain junction region [Mus musculus]MBK4185404.1 immunoglobulin heavy chain junction region [Mus musculus]MBK4185405.1 immunoglobulin heavy chain junction region [Mus musculus]MBK4185406.1 immunoglobulin heavy chain junction region [Mus musculus]